MCNQLSTLRILDEARNLSLRARDRMNLPLFRLLYKDISRNPDQYDLEDVYKKAELYIERNKRETGTISASEKSTKLRTKRNDLQKSKERRRLQVVNNCKVWNAETALSLLKAEGLISLARTILLKNPKDIDYLVRILADSLEDILFTRNSMLYILRIVYGQTVTVRNTRGDVNCYYCGCKRCETNLVRIEFYEKEILEEPKTTKRKADRDEISQDTIKRQAVKNLCESLGNEDENRVMMPGKMEHDLPNMIGSHKIEKKSRKKEQIKRFSNIEDREVFYDRDGGMKIERDADVGEELVRKKVMYLVCPRLSADSRHICASSEDLVAVKVNVRDRMVGKYIDGFIEFIKPIIDALNWDVRKRSTRHKSSYTNWGVFDFKEKQYRELIELQFAKCTLNLKDISEKISGEKSG